MEDKQKYWKISPYKDYFQLFFDKQPAKVKAKIVWTLRFIEELYKIPKSYLKSIKGSNGLYELRIQVEGNAFRIFCFFDKGQLIILMDGFQKKTQKTPKSEIKRAQKIKAEYEREKQQSNDS